LTQVFLGTNDVSELITRVPLINLSSGQIGGLITNDLPALLGDNITGFWDTRNPRSPFFGVEDLSVFSIKVIVDDNTIFDGFIQGISADNRAKTAEITVKSILQTALESTLIAVTDDQINDIYQQTPADAVAEIAADYLLPIDSASFGASNTVYNADNVYISLELIRPEMTMLDAFQQIANIGVARIYAVNGVLFFDAFQNKTGASPLETFSDDPATTGGALLEPPRSDSLEKETQTGYSIEWAGTPAATFGDSEEQGVSIAAGMDAGIKITSLNAAIWVGERWLKYLAAGQQTITFRIPIEYGRVLPLGSIVRVDYSFWDPVDVEVIAIDNSQLVSSEVRGTTLWRNS
jgi:hypothetical protein